MFQKINKTQRGDALNRNKKKIKTGKTDQEDGLDRNPQKTGKTQQGDALDRNPQ
jgi:hypothetical protein